MPSEVKLSKTTIDNSYRLILTWDLEFDITATDLDFKQSVEGIPLVGDWEIAVKCTDGAVDVSLNWGAGVTAGAFGEKVELKLELQWVTDEGVASKVCSVGDCTPLPAIDPSTGDIYGGEQFSIERADTVELNQRTNGRFDPAVHRLYRIVATFWSAYPSDQSKKQAREAEALAKRVSGVPIQPFPHNVRLFFPHVYPGGVELWMKAEVLQRSSPWFKDLLDSDCAESVARRSKRARKSSTPEVARPFPAKDFVDSDDETDEFLFLQHPPRLDSSSILDDLSYRQITITQTAFSTYYALIVFLTTGFIHFAPLSSSFVSSTTSDRSTRLAFLSTCHDVSRDLPLPVSPKSLYRLAHLLSLTDLQKRALDTFSSSLSVDNAAVELFSDTSMAYDELRAVILLFVKENWTKVKESTGWKELLAKIKAREMPEVAHILAEALTAMVDA